MASGDDLAYFVVQQNEPPASNAAERDNRNQHPVLDFDATTDEESVFTGLMPAFYSAGGIYVDCGISMSTASSNNVVIQVALEKFDDEVQDIDSDNFASFVSSGAIAVPTTNGDVKRVRVTISNGSPMGNVGAGDAFRLKVRRDADDTSATDNASGDMELRFVHVIEQ